MPADYDGDGRTDLAVYRTATSDWFVFGSTAGFNGGVQFGAAHLGDVPMPADYDGDGKADVAVYRPTTGEWLGFGTTAGSFGPLQLGNPSLGDIPLGVRIPQ